jgi:glycosyltransferase involved in cell wall biosynthesis
MAKAALVVAGNDYLAQRARLAGAPWVEVVPTVIDLNRYPLPLAIDCNGSADPFCVVWIGSPSTAQYLKLIEKALQAFAKKWPLLLRVIGADFKIAGVQTECVQWTEATEVESIAAGHVGVMPLQDSPWERGKCGYKLIQYMACGLPVVASPVGVNNQIVEHGVNGFLARSDAEWEIALEQLFAHVQLRQRMGKAGRAKVEAQYCIQKTGPKMAELLKKAAKSG